MLQEKDLGRRPNWYELFVQTHTRNHDKEKFVDEKSRQINVGA